MTSGNSISEIGPTYRQKNGTRLMFSSGSVNSLSQSDAAATLGMRMNAKMSAACRKGVVCANPNAGAG